MPRILAVTISALIGLGYAMLIYRSFPFLCFNIDIRDCK
jgi:hypothetical protein